MSKNKDINQIKRAQFNRMYATLHEIAHNYYPAASLKQAAEKKYGLAPDAAVEKAYENIRVDAARALKGVRPIE